MEHIIELTVPSDFSSVSARHAIDLFIEKFKSYPLYFLVYGYGDSECRNIERVCRSDDINIKCVITTELHRDSWMLIGEEGKCVYSSGAW